MFGHTGRMWPNGVCQEQRGGAMNHRIVVPAALREALDAVEKRGSLHEGNSSAQGMVSVIVPCVGQVEYTRFCVSSVFRHTRVPFELIFLSVDSLDGTQDYLAGVKAAAPVRVEILDVFEESHLPGLFDEGVKTSAGEFVILLDNDTIVPKHWIEQLTGLAVSQAVFGVVGPMSNHACPPQLIPFVPNWTSSQRSLVRIERPSGVGQAVGIEQNVEAFAQEWRVRNQGKWLEASELEPFCLLFKRSVIASLGSLSRLARSPAEMIDGRLLDKGALSKQILLAGYKLACCADLFVYHAGTREAIYIEQNTDIDVGSSQIHVTGDRLARS